MKKAIVCDNSGTLLERHRAIKDIETGEIFTNINSLDLIESEEYLNLVVLQFDSSKFVDFPKDMLISEIIRKLDIDFDVSFYSNEISQSKIADIIYNDYVATVKDITDGFNVLRKVDPPIKFCNGSALIVDIKKECIRYTITSGGGLFPSVRQTISQLKERDVEIFIASGDRKGAILKLARLLDIEEENAFGSVTTVGKCEIVQELEKSGYRVLMVGDGLNDVMAFDMADISVLTLEQGDEVSDTLLNKTDFVIEKFSELLSIVDNYL